MTLTSIIIVACNGLAYTRRCVESIVQHTSSAYELIGIDNGSTDGTAEYWQTLPHIKWIRNETDIGFAAGCNQGLGVSAGDEIVLLDHREAAIPHWLDILPGRPPGETGFRSFVANTRFGVHRPPNLRADRENASRRESGYDRVRANGSCLFINPCTLKRIGGLDEQFATAAYAYEDFGLRAAIAGRMTIPAFLGRTSCGEPFPCEELDGSQTWTHGGAFQRRLDDAERFRSKWSVGMSAYEIERYGYSAAHIAERDCVFLPELHFIPLPYRETVLTVAGGNEEAEELR